MGACNIVHHVTAFVQFALAVAIAVVVGIKLFTVTVSQGDDVEVETSCLLGTDYNSESLCIYVFVVAGISVIVSLLISLVQCVTCHLCGIGGVLDVIFAAAGTAWWIIASAIVTKHANQANGVLPEENWRNTVVGMMWAEVGVFGIMFLSGLIRPVL